MSFNFITRHNLTKDEIGLLASFYVFNRWTTKLLTKQPVQHDAIARFDAIGHANALAELDAAFVLSRSFCTFVDEIAPVFLAAPGELAPRSAGRAWDWVMEFAREAREMAAEEGRDIFDDDDEEEEEEEGEKGGFWDDVVLEGMLAKLGEKVVAGSEQGSADGDVDGPAASAADCADDDRGDAAHEAGGTDDDHDSTNSDEDEGDVTIDADSESDDFNSPYDPDLIKWPQSKQELAAFAVEYQRKRWGSNMVDETYLEERAWIWRLSIEGVIQQMGEELTKFCKDVHSLMVTLPDSGDGDDEDDNERGADSEMVEENDDDSVLGPRSADEDMEDEDEDEDTAAPTAAAPKNAVFAVNHTAVNFIAATTKAKPTPERARPTFQLGRHITLANGSAFDQSSILPLYARNARSGKLKAHHYRHAIDWDSRTSIRQLNKWATQILRRKRHGLRGYHERLLWTQIEKDWVSGFFDKNPLATIREAYVHFLARFGEAGLRSREGFGRSVRRHGLRISVEEREALRVEAEAEVEADAEVEAEDGDEDEDEDDNEDEEE